MLLFKRDFLGISAIAVTAALSQPAFAQQVAAPSAAATPQAAPASSQLEEIVVTAQKRDQNLQKVPLAITAIGGPALESRGITNIVDLGGSVPGLNFQKFNGVILPFLRGVGNTTSGAGVESSVAIYADGVYFSRLPTSFFDLSNVERVEVLKGPQGTLFGRNATGGVINIVTKDPTHDPVLKGSIGYGRFNALSGNLYTSFGLSNDLAMDLSVIGKTDTGFGRNLTTGHGYGYEDSILVRSKLLFEPAAGTRILLSGFYSWSKQSGNKAAFPGTASTTISAPPAIYRSEQFGYYNAISDVDQRHIFESKGGALRVEQDLDFARLVSITAYSNLRETSFFDGDYTPRPDFHVDAQARVDLFTQELQLVSKSGSALDWILGLYYYNNVTAYTDVQFVSPIIFGPGVSAPARQKSTSYAAFAQATYEIAPGLKLTGGFRYTRDKTTGSGRLDLNTVPPIDLTGGLLPPSTTRVEEPSYKVAVDYQFTPNILGYALFSHGFKSGNYNILTYNSTKPTDPEKLDDYEIGLKTDLFDRRVRLNGALFYYKIKNPQVSLIKNSTTFYSNAGGSRVKGAEMDLQALVMKGLTARASFAYLDSVYTDYVNAPTSIPDLINGGALPAPDINAKGKQTPLAAKTTFNIGADYSFETGIGKATLTADFYHNSGYYFEPDNFLHQGAYNLLSAQMKLAISENLAVRVWGKNLTNSKYVVAAATQLGPAGYPWSPAAPITYGAALDFRF